MIIPNKKWWFKAIFTSVFFPIIVLGLTAFYSDYRSKKSIKSKEIRYSIEPPFIYFKPASDSSLKINLNGIKTQQLVAYKIHLWSSGSNSVAKFRVKYRFGDTVSNFKILYAVHNTIPPYQFGYINELESNQYSKTYEYELINRKDDIIVSFLTNGFGELKAYAKEAEVDFVEEKTTNDKLSIIKASTHIIYIFTITVLIIFLFFSFKRLKDIYFVLGNGNVDSDLENIERRYTSEIQKVHEKFSTLIERKSKTTPKEDWKNHENGSEK